MPAVCAMCTGLQLECCHSVAADQLHVSIARKKLFFQLCCQFVESLRNTIEAAGLVKAARAMGRHADIRQFVFQLVQHRLLALLRQPEQLQGVRAQRSRVRPAVVFRAPVFPAEAVIRPT